MGWITTTRDVVRALIRLEHDMGAVAEGLAGVQDQLAKAQSEIVAKLAELEQRLNDAGKLDAEDQAALDAVKASAQRLDDIVPDVPAEEPEQPAEPEPTDQPEQ